MNRAILSIRLFLPVTTAALAVAVFSGAASASQSDRGELLEKEIPAMTELRETGEELREELRKAEQAALEAGGSTDAELAARVVLQEDLLLSERSINLVWNLNLQTERAACRSWRKHDGDSMI